MIQKLIKWVLVFTLLFCVIDGKLGNKSKVSVKAQLKQFGFYCWAPCYCYRPGLFGGSYGICWCWYPCYCLGGFGGGGGIFASATRARGAGGAASTATAGATSPPSGLGSTPSESPPETTPGG